MIVLFSHQKGGVGKSTVCINIAYLLSKKYSDSLIIDLDTQNSSTLFNLVRKQKNLEIIKCFKEDQVEFEKLLEKYKKDKNNLLLIDSGGYDSDINRLALVKADIIITPVGISQIEIFGLQKFRNILKDAATMLKRDIKSHILINNADKRSKKSITDLQEYISTNDKYFNLLNSILHTRADFKNSYSEGLVVTELNKNSAASDELKSLCDELIQIIEEN